MPAGGNPAAPYTPLQSALTASGQTGNSPKLELFRVPALAWLDPDPEPERLGCSLFPRALVVDLKVGGPFLARAEMPTPDAARAGRARRRLEGIVLDFEDRFAGGAEMPAVARRAIFGKFELERLAENHLHRAPVLVLVDLHHCTSPLIENAPGLVVPRAIL